MTFGQLIIGPPGSGKTTYCNGMQQYLQMTGRKVAVINLDPANDALPYDCSVDIADLVSLDAVMETYNLGPNGGKLSLTICLPAHNPNACDAFPNLFICDPGLLYCMEFLEQNMDWLKEKIDPLIEGEAKHAKSLQQTMCDWTCAQQEDKYMRLSRDGDTDCIKDMLLVCRRLLLLDGLSGTGRAVHPARQPTQHCPDHDQQVACQVGS